MFWKTALIKTMRTKRGRGNSSGGRKAYVLMAKHAPMGFPNPFHCYHFFSYSLTKRCFHTLNSSIFRGLKTSKTHIFPCSSNAFLSKTCVWMVHFASFSFARLLPLCVFWSAFLPTFPPFSWHSTSPFPPETTSFSFISLQFDAFSSAFSCKKHG